MVFYRPIPKTYVCLAELRVHWKCCPGLPSCPPFPCVQQRTDTLNWPRQTSPINSGIRYNPLPSPPRGHLPVGHLAPRIFAPIHSTCMDHIEGLKWLEKNINYTFKAGIWWFKWACIWVPPFHLYGAFNSLTTTWSPFTFVPQVGGFGVVCASPVPVNCVSNKYVTINRQMFTKGHE